MPKTAGQALQNSEVLVARIQRLVGEGIVSGFEPHCGMDEIKTDGRRKLTQKALKHVPLQMGSDE